MALAPRNAVIRGEKLPSDKVKHSIILHTTSPPLPTRGDRLAEVRNQEYDWAIPQYPGHLRREILIFSQKSLRTICTYHLVPFKLPKNVQRCPFQGLLVFKNFFQKISYFTKYVLTPTFKGRPSSVIPFRKALAFLVAGPYWSLS